MAANIEDPRAPTVIADAVAIVADEQSSFDDLKRPHTLETI